MPGLLPEKKWLIRLEACAFILCLCVAANLAAEVGVGFAEPSRLRSAATTALLVLLPVGGGTLASCCLSFFPWKVIAASVVVLIGFVASFGDWDERQTFIHRIDRVRNGMTINQVAAVFSSNFPDPPDELEPKYVPESVEPLRPTALRQFRWSKTEADIAQIYFRNGLVVATNFVADD